MNNASKETELLGLFGGLTLNRVQPEWNGSPVPHVFLGFSGNRIIKVEVDDGVVFQACMINTLRRSQPVCDVVISKKEAHTFVQLWARDFPLVTFLGLNRGRPSKDFPFIFTEEK